MLLSWGNNSRTDGPEVCLQHAGTTVHILLPPSLFPYICFLNIPKLSIIHKQPFCLFCEPASEQKRLNPNHREPERRLTCPKPCSSPSRSRRQLILSSLYTVINCMNLSCWKRQQKVPRWTQCESWFQATVNPGQLDCHCLSREWPKKTPCPHARVIEPWRGLKILYFYLCINIHF